MTNAGVSGWTPGAVEATRRAVQRRLSVKWLSKAERRSLAEAMEALEEERQAVEAEPHVYHPNLEAGTPRR